MLRMGVDELVPTTGLSSLGKGLLTEGEAATQFTEQGQGRRFFQVRIHLWGGGKLLLKYEMVFLLGPCSGFLREEDKSDTN